MHINQFQETITIPIKNKDDLEKISSMRLDLLLRQEQKKKIKPRRTLNKSEHLVTCEVPAQLRSTIPIKEATVSVNSITVTLIKANPGYSKEPR